MKQIVEKCTLSAPGRTFKNIDLVLLGAPLQGIQQIDQTIGKESVSKKRVVRPSTKSYCNHN